MNSTTLGFCRSDERIGSAGLVTRVLYICRLRSLNIRALTFDDKVIAFIEAITVIIRILAISCSRLCAYITFTGSFLWPHVFSFLSGRRANFQAGRQQQNTYLCRLPSRCIYRHELWAGQDAPAWHYAAIGNEHLGITISELLNRAHIQPLLTSTPSALSAIIHSEDRISRM